MINGTNHDRWMAYGLDRLAADRTLQIPHTSTSVFCMLIALTHVHGLSESQPQRPTDRRTTFVINTSSPSTRLSAFDYRTESIGYPPNGFRTRRNSTKRDSARYGVYIRSEFLLVKDCGRIVLHS